MSGERPPTSGGDPSCPVCSKAIHKGDAVISSHGELIHAHCRVEAIALGDVIETFVRQHPDKAFCGTCLSKRLRFDVGEVEQAAMRLQRNGRVHMSLQTCAVCTESRVTIQAVREAGQPK